MWSLRESCNDRYEHSLKRLDERILILQRKILFFSFQKYLPVIIWCHVHFIRVNWNKYSFVQAVAQDIISPHSQHQVIQRRECAAQLPPFKGLQLCVSTVRGTEPWASLSPELQFAQDRFVNTAVRAMSILADEMGLLSSLEANWHSATFILLVKLSYLQKQSGHIQAVY